jgi:C1A family cysteine protease
MKEDIVVRHTAHRFALFAALCCCSLLLAIGVAASAGASRTTAPGGGTLHGSAAPLSPAFLRSLVDPPVGTPSIAAGHHGLGERPAPQDFSYSRGLQVSEAPHARQLGTLPATYDLRSLGRVTAVKNQGAFGTCWAFASCGSLESGLLPGETADFSEDNMALTSGFDNGGSAYNHGGNIDMSIAYLVRWGGPVSESDDPYGDSTTPAGLAARKHVQQVYLIPPRASALDNDNIKNAVMQYGAAYVSMGWYDSAYKSSTASYYYNGSSSTNHGVLIVGWDDSFPAANFATAPAGNGAFIVKNSWGTGFGSSGYFYASYYDVRFGRSGPMAVFDRAEPSSNYTGIYQYDPLGDCSNYGYSNSTAWFANVFTAQANASLSAVGFYALAPGTSYEVYTGTSLATKTLSTSGTLAQMGYHTVTVGTPVAVANSQPFIVAVKVTSPGTTYPIAFEAPYSGYSSAASAQAGQSYVSSSGSSWTDLTTQIAGANVCLKAYVSTPASAAPTITGITPTSAPVGTVVTLTGTDLAGATAVSFHGTATPTFDVVNATQITATVPAGATSGPITVTTPGGIGVSVASLTVTPTPTLTVTAPTGTGSSAAGSNLTVSWTSTAAVSTGEFGVWARSSGGGWYVGKLVTAAGGTSFSTSLTLDVPVGTGYQVIVAWRPTVGSGSWSSFGTSPGVFAVTP